MVDDRHRLAVGLAQAREQAEPVEPWTDTKGARLVLLEATVRILHHDLTRLMAALEKLG